MPVTTAAPQQLQQRPARQPQLSVLSIDADDKLAAAILALASTMVPTPTLDLATDDNDYPQSSHCIETSASTLVNMYAFIFQLLYFIFSLLTQ